MWSRVIVILLGLWLMASPYIIPDNSVSLAFLTLHGLALFSLACLAAVQKFEKAAVAVFIHGLYLFGHGRFLVSHPHPPQAQNLIVIGLLVMMIIILPLNDQTPPHALEKGMLEDEAL